MSNKLLAIKDWMEWRGIKTDELAIVGISMTALLAVAGIFVYAFIESLVL